MLSAKIVHCLNLPPLIQSEIKEQYPQWFDECSFDNSGGYGRSELLIMPADVFIKNKKNLLYRNVIPFGPPSLLEPSFMAGASDYLKDPWSSAELIIRSRAYLGDLTLSVKDYRLVYRNYGLYINSIHVALTPSQKKLIKILLTNPNSYLSYSSLCDYMEIKSDHAVNSLHVQMHHLRKILKTYLPDSYGKDIEIKNSSTFGYALIFTCG